MQICSVPFSIAISNWPSFVGSKSFHSSHDSATSSKVSGVLRVSPQGYGTEFYAGRLRPEIQPLILPFYLPFVTEKVTSFVYLLLTNGTPFTYLCT